MAQLNRHYPDYCLIDGHAYAFDRVLKDDFFSVNVVYTSPTTPVKYVLKLSDFRFLGGWLLRPLAGFMSWREYAIYSMVADLPGVPGLGPRFGERGYFHMFIEGKTLFEVKDPDNELPPDYFDQLRRTFDAVHERGIAYLDGNKLGNLLLGDDRQAYLIDYQICLPFPRQGWLARLTAPLFEQLCRDDRYHLYKHKRHYQPDRLTPDEAKQATKSPFNKAYDTWVGTPYKRVKRLIYPHGSNEIPWYKWKHLKHQHLAEHQTQIMP
jgi:hypothetical protein